VNPVRLTPEHVRIAATDENGEDRTWADTAERLNEFLWRSAPLTAEDVVDRAAVKDKVRRRRLLFLAACLFTAGMGLGPWHDWMHAHRELFMGIFLGTIWQSIPWLIDRWRWLKLFSWQ